MKLDLGRFSTSAARRLWRWQMPMALTSALKPVKRVVVTVVGATVLAVGIALLVLPGPAFLLLPLGLAILAVEFAWARRWLRSARAILPRNAKTNASGTKPRITVQSVRRSLGFLLRQMRRTIFPKRKVT